MRYFDTKIELSNFKIARNSNIRFKYLKKLSQLKKLKKKFQTETSLFFLKL